MPPHPDVGAGLYRWSLLVQLLVEAGVADLHTRCMASKPRSWDMLSRVAGLLALDGVGHLHGWQWLFLVEGALTVLMGIYLAMALASDPSKASALWQSSGTELAHS